MRSNISEPFWTSSECLCLRSRARSCFCLFFSIFDRNSLGDKEGIKCSEDGVNWNDWLKTCNA